MARRLKSVVEPLRLHYVSDIHLERRAPKMRLKVKRPQTNIHGLVLAGDIGVPHMDNYRWFLEDCSRKYKKVYIVAGNHEYDATGSCYAEMESIRDGIRGVVDRCNDNVGEERVKFLDNSGLFISENIYLYGSTLWSQRYALSDMDRLINRLNDYSVEALVSQMDYFEACNWFNDIFRVNEIDKVKMLVVSHYPPSFGMISEEYKQRQTFYKDIIDDKGERISMQDRYANALDDLVLKDPVRWWICGHSHSVMNVSGLGLGAVRCVMNSVGYPSKNSLKTGIVPVLELVLK